MDLGTLLRFVLVPWPSCCSSGRRNGSSAASSREVLGLMLCGESNGDRRRPRLNARKRGRCRNAMFLRPLGALPSPIGVFRNRAKFRFRNKPFVRETGFSIADGSRIPDPSFVAVRNTLPENNSCLVGLCESIAESIG